MTTEDDFQNHLDLNPLDFHTRLVFADWLEERDDPRGPAYREPAVPLAEWSAVSPEDRTYHCTKAWTALLAVRPEAHVAAKAFYVRFLVDGVAPVASGVPRIGRAVELAYEWLSDRDDAAVSAPVEDALTELVRSSGWALTDYSNIGRTTYMLRTLLRPPNEWRDVWDVVRLRDGTFRSDREVHTWVCRLIGLFCVLDLPAALRLAYDVPVPNRSRGMEALAIDAWVASRTGVPT